MIQKNNSCGHFGVCGGCRYQGTPYDDSLFLKQNAAKEDFIKALGESFEGVFEGILPSPSEYSYRNKMEYSFGDEVKDGELTLGLHPKKRFYSIINTDGCLITDPDFELIVKAVRSYFISNNTPYYHKKSHEGYLMHLLIRKGFRSGEIMVSLITNNAELCALPLSEPKLLDGFTEAVLNSGTRGNVVSLLHVVNTSLADAVKCDSYRVLSGRDYIFEEINGLKFKITQFSFFQTNTEGAELLYNTAVRFLKDTADTLGHVYDLYSGTGTIAQIVSGVADRVSAIEIVHEAVMAAKENAKINGITNCEFLCGDVFETLDALNDKPDTIILDPPREGVGMKALKKIIPYEVPNILYISCKYKSLLSEMPVFTEFGYVPKRIVFMDMFPWAEGIEVICLLTKKQED